MQFSHTTGPCTVRAETPGGAAGVGTPSPVSPPAQTRRGRLRRFAGEYPQSGRATRAGHLQPVTTLRQSTGSQAGAAAATPDLPRYRLGTSGLGTSGLGTSGLGSSGLGTSGLGTSGLGTS